MSASIPDETHAYRYGSMLVPEIVNNKDSICNLVILKCMSPPHIVPTGKASICISGFVTMAK